MKAQDRSIPLNVYASHFQSPYTPTLLFLPATWTIRNVAAHVGAKVTYHCELDIILVPIGHLPMSALHHLWDVKLSYVHIIPFAES